MNRLMRTAFAVITVGAAAFMLFLAIGLIRKNSPRPTDGDVRITPPTSPAVNISTGQSRSNSFIGGVGIVEPVGEATIIGSQIPGVVEEVFVLPGDHVAKGDALLQLDPRAATADVRVAEAELQAQQAKLTELLGQLDVLRARLAASEALLQQARSTESNSKREFDRSKEIGTYALSVEEVDLRRLNWETATARLQEAEAKVGEARANYALLAQTPSAPTMDVQKAAVAQAEANLARARTNLEMLTVRAPKDATILSVKVRKGEYAPASILSTPLITIGVVDPLHIRVDIDESEIPRFDTASRAYASVRGRPEQRVPLEYVRTEPLVIPKRVLTGTVSERVDTRVMQVIYRVVPADLRAAVGQQVDVYIEDRADR